VGRSGGSWQRALATPAPAGQALADVMIRFPKVCGTDTTVGQAREHLLDDHVHTLLVVDGGVLVAVIERADLLCAPATDAAWSRGRLADRVVDVGADLAFVTREMLERGRRRLAVVDDGGRLVGLLCRKRSGHGFCSDDGVAARAAGRAAGIVG
jgi:CBS domain-containing protein